MKKHSIKLQTICEKHKLLKRLMLYETTCRRDVGRPRNMACQQRPEQSWKEVDDDDDGTFLCNYLT